MRRRWVAAAAVAGAALLVAPARAQDLPTPMDLPNTEQAVAWIDQDPAVVEARSALVAAGHGAAALRAGSHEWVAKASTSRRQVGGVGHSSEWSAGIERAIRSGGKAQLDGQLGEVELAIGQALVGEARHEAARALADLWLDWLAAGRLQALLAQQLQFVQANLRAVEARQRAGDASALDSQVARTDLAEVQRQASLAASTLAKARARLAARFPAPPVEAPRLADPVAPAPGLETWRERILAEADPIKVAEGAVRKAELVAARARADRSPDPTLGLYTAQEAFRNERIVGISISLPFGGGQRDARARQTLQDVETARTALQRVRRALEAEVAGSWIDATGSIERWRIAEQGGASAQESARLTQRAYTLGEADLQALLLVRRQALDAARAALEARVEALRAGYRLMIDAHRIWDLEHD